MTATIKELAQKHEPYIIEMRREFHMYPEVSLKEERTSKRILEELQKMGIPCELIAGTGVVGVISGGHPGKTIGLRADIDALEITEKNDVPYKSKIDGVMHACGHDTHAAMLLGAARILNDMKADLHGAVKLMFQPAEEVAQGAKRMIEEGVMDGVDEVFGMHSIGIYPTGKIAIKEGAIMASTDMFRITIKGVGGHGSMPSLGVDAVMVAASVVMNLQTIVSRECSPLDTVVVSVGKVVAGTRWNIIADEAVLEGTVRYFNPAFHDTMPGTIERIAKSTAAAHRAEASLEYDYLTAPTINNEVSAERARKATAKVLSEDAVIEMAPTTGSEDFSEFLMMVPGAYVSVGTANEEKGTCFNNHHPQFNIDEDMLRHGAALYAQYSCDFLHEDK